MSFRFPVISFDVRVLSLIVVRAFRLLYFSIDLHFVFYVVSLFMCYFVFMHFVLHDAFSLFAYSAQPLGFHFVMHCFITFVVFHVCSSTLIFSSFNIFVD